MYKLIVVVLATICLSCVVNCEDVYSKCGDSIDCVEKEMVKYVDKLENEKSVPILGDLVSLEKTGNSQAARSEGIVDRGIRYLEDHAIRIGVPSRNNARSLVDESRSKKLRKILLPIILFLKLKAAIIVPAVLSAIALVAFKGMGAGVMALVIAGATALKSALENSGSKLTYEVVPQLASPHWSRIGVDPLAQTQGYHTII